MSELVAQERSFLQILEREDGNLDRIYLYKEGDCWYAYEMSAYLFWFWLGDGRPIQKVVNTLYEVCLVRVSLSDTLYQQLLTAERQEVSMNEAYLNVPIQVSVNAFGAWKDMAWRRELPLVNIQSA